MIEFHITHDEDRIFRALDYSYPSNADISELPFENTGRRNAVEIIYNGFKKDSVASNLIFYEVWVNKITVGLTVTVPDHNLLYWFSGNHIFWHKTNEWFDCLFKVLQKPFYCSIYDSEKKKRLILAQAGMTIKNKVDNVFDFSDT